MILETLQGGDITNVPFAHLQKMLADNIAALQKSDVKSPVSSECRSSVVVTVPIPCNSGVSFEDPPLSASASKLADHLKTRIPKTTFYDFTFFDVLLPFYDFTKFRTSHHAISSF